MEADIPTQARTRTEQAVYKSVLTAGNPTFFAKKSKGCKRWQRDAKGKGPEDFQNKFKQACGIQERTVAGLLRWYGDFLPNCCVCLIPSSDSRGNEHGKDLWHLRSSWQKEQFWKPVSWLEGRALPGRTCDQNARGPRYYPQYHTQTNHTTVNH